MMTAFPAEAYVRLESLCAEQGMDVGVEVSLLAFNAFMELDLRKLEFWIRVSDIVIERAAEPSRVATHEMLL